ncbi:hypothetical protein JQK87_04820 [Streptomyces sp. G44]|uniref:hypothetical protein n=1 Tax=Streptomyces sp. G44 TaxID=2807632 RepID=UPI0019602643|nr:hypothetical protein [Streptomyces sp. G44]MBM7167741.1 hypothetical protein [Streptomyces sp. G44]
MSVSFTAMIPDDPVHEAYARLMHGTSLSQAVKLSSGEEQRHQEEFSRIWERLLYNAGVTEYLARGQGLGWQGGLPRRTVQLADGRTSDLISLIPWVLQDKVAGDVAYEDIARRREQVARGHGLEPGDAA